MGILKRKLQEIDFRMKLRKSLQEETIELVKITFEESKKELERRQKKK